MNYIRHLTGFFEKVAQDQTLNPTHISLYVALFQFWNFSRFRNPISISRDEVMRISKISSKATYHKCLKNLHALGYIDYRPSYNPFRGSQVLMLDLTGELKPAPKQTRTKNEQFPEPLPTQAEDKPHTGIETGGGQVLVPSINSINNTNNSNGLNLDKPSDHFSDKEALYDEKEKSSAKKEKPVIANLKQSGAIEEDQSKIPELSDIQSYFRMQSYPGIEAEKFYNYFSSNGWLVGGKTRMKDWQAAARNWMLNTQKYSQNGKQSEYTDRAGSLSAATGKNYAEPL